MRAAVVLAAFLFASCGGGGSPAVLPPSAQEDAPHIFAWDPPTKCADNSAFDPRAELDRTDVYASVDGAFSDNDLPCASVSALDNAGELARSLNLLNLVPFGIGPESYFAARSVSKDNAVSRLSEAVWWGREP